jgi:3-hydroxyacyl-CoA dehydrogenase / enoyl-CoA hydratase / 3-hydroxybutyryl-CoA epimerase
VKPREVKKVGVLGGGLMGGGIAYVSAALQGVPVRVKDKDDAGVGRALKQVQGIFDERVKKRSLTWREAAAMMALVTGGTGYEGFKNVDLVIEAVFEDLALKHRIMGEVEAVTREDCIFASNTSSIPITELARGSQRPAQVIGMHYFSPVNKMPLLEIITHPGTADWVTATCVEVGKKQGKTVIVVNDGPGFYTSRILAPYMNEAAHLLADGADIAALDKALVEFGFPVGPITLLDEVGIDVAQKVGPLMESAFGKRMAAPRALEKVVAEGRLGRKNKKGFYTYDGKKKKEVDVSVYELLPHGRNRKSLDSREMAERCTLQMVNEAVRCLGEGILRSARDGDVGAIFGLGFPPFLGGPFRYADSLGPAELLRRLEHYQDKYGERFTPAPYLLDMVKAGKTFYPR